MKILEEKIMIEEIKKIYISEDGKKFDTQKECENYEYALNLADLKVKTKFIKQFNYTPPLVNESYNYIWFYVKNQEEVKLIEDYYSKSDNLIKFEYLEFPQWIGIEEGYDGDAWGLGTFEQYKKDVLKMEDLLRQMYRLSL